VWARRMERHVTEVLGTTARGSYEQAAGGRRKKANESWARGWRPMHKTISSKTPQQGGSSTGAACPQRICVFGSQRRGRKGRGEQAQDGHGEGCAGAVEALAKGAVPVILVGAGGWRARGGAMGCIGATRSGHCGGHWQAGETEGQAAAVRAAVRVAGRHGKAKTPRARTKKLLERRILY
jgi:hypothetical protein